ncbi:hypothetical protein [Bradyrhizobium sp.]|uniref:hypothetical protein n=1 Tax=Bradyrhizobium sp. TaxID=376 RepID=UPI00239C4625|nr:hypothetical protein [Bradyrhizobium sp.]MDE2380341.1 hypothetical protein [Bradyrhizobium sp.]
MYAKTISRDGKLQPESLFCIAGALAGFAAQYAVRQEMADAGGIDAHAAVVTQAPGSPIDPASHADDVVIAQAPNGERYYFSDRINRLLMPDRLESMSAYSVLGGQAMRLGAARSELPDCFTMLERAASTMGTSEFGVFRGPAGHVPAMPARRAIEIFWPATLTAFSREPVVPVPGFKLLPPRLWAVALAMIAATYMEMVKGALTPALALAIFMEAAIPMSKIDQAAVHFVRDTTH